MCLTCGCEQAHLKMGDNVTYEDLKRIADGNRGMTEMLQRRESRRPRCLF